jgi:hypothetical protein
MPATLPQSLPVEAAVSSSFWVQNYGVSASYAKNYCYKARAQVACARTYYMRASIMGDFAVS